MPAEQAQEQQAQVPTGPTRPLQILLVEDNQVNQLVASSLLYNPGDSALVNLGMLLLAAAAPGVITGYVMLFLFGSLCLVFGFRAIKGGSTKDA